MTEITAQVQAFYNRFPYPPEPLLDMPPLGWNWRWSWDTIYSLYYGHVPPKQNIKILDAGCGTGFGTQYLGYQNPQAQVWGIDLSETALQVAQERCQRAEVTNVQFQQGSFLDLDQAGFDFINCVGVVHHLVDPLTGFKALAQRLAPGGLMHLFIYSELGRWEISLMQEALRRLGVKDVATGRQVFAALDPTNRLRHFEQTRWADENREDSSFADMYLQVQETRFNILSLLDQLDHAGLTLVGFSNPEFWQIERILKDPTLIAQIQALPKWEQWRVIELLDPVANHYELFVSHQEVNPWQPTDLELLGAIPQRSAYIGRWPSLQVFNYCYQEYTLTPDQLQWLKVCDGQHTVAQIQAQITLDLPEIRVLVAGLLILLERSPASKC